MPKASRSTTSISWCATVTCRSTISSSVSLHGDAVYLPEHEREQAKHHPLFNAQSTSCEYLAPPRARLYGFAACPFDEGVVMVVTAPAATAPT
jgi:hypothetical protein